jgi:hypothetical protein
LENESGLKISTSEEGLLSNGLKELLNVCLGPAHARPSARRLCLEFRRLRRRTNDVVGHILRQIEKHANQLEEVVAERTQALEIEMANADALLQEMLPR